MKKYKVAIVGYAHSHIIPDASDFAKLTDRVEMVGGADVKPLVEPVNDSQGTRYGIMRELNKNLGITDVYDDWKLMIDEKKPDIAVVNCENAFHGDVCSYLLERGIHVVVEKPMATCDAMSRQMLAAAEKGGAELIVNWPTAWSAGVRAMKKLFDTGITGKLIKFTYRNADSKGPLSYGQVLTPEEMGKEWWYQKAAGGGVMLDYCCYGSVLSSWFFNEKATEVAGYCENFASPFGDVEDYAEFTARFPSGVALIEGTWVTQNMGVPNGPIAFGYDGTLVADGDTVYFYKDRHSRVPNLTVKADPLPVGRATLGEEVLHHLDTGEPLFDLLRPELNARSIAIIDAGRRSTESGRIEKVN